MENKMFVQSQEFLSEEAMSLLLRQQTFKETFMANQLLQQSATSGVIELQRLKVQQSAIDKWDGKLPQVTGSAIPFISLSNSSV